MELLRVVCMLFIMIHHFIVHVFYPGLSVRDGNIDPYRIVCVLINGFTYVAVNCFILISGYYAIKFKVKSLFNLYCICVFYAVLTVLFSYFSEGIPFDRSLFYKVFFPFSHSSWWFIKCYVILYLLSPLLNKAVNSLQREEFVFSLVLLFVFNFYFGYYWHLHNDDGYNVWQFVFIYFIGAFLRKYPLLKLNRGRSFLLYVLCALIWSTLTLVSVKWKVPHWVPFNYHNPFVVVGAVGLFLFFLNSSFHLHWINVLASTVLAAYLIQGGPVYKYSRIFKDMVIGGGYSTSFEVISMLLFVIFASIVVMGLAFCLEKIRVLLMAQVWRIYGFVKKGVWQSVKE